jgi:hypothetical protein
MEKVFFIIWKIGRTRLPEVERFTCVAVSREMSAERFNRYFNGLDKVLTTFDDK